ncbi:MAG: phytoene/squalene synthase family protein [Acidimicrobiales bacterium]
MALTGNDLISDSYARCEKITSAQARNFSYGIRLLPPAERRAMSAIYAMARRIDDIGDGDLSTDAKLKSLAAARASLDAIQSGGRAGGRSGGEAPGEARGEARGEAQEELVGLDDPVMLALGDAARQFPIPMAAFGDLIEGCEMDASGSVYETFDELVVYCRCVAGSIGRLSLGVFGSTDQGVATAKADSLGVALQVTNILRDLVEDRDVLGRVYLPREDLARFGVSPDLDGSPDDLSALVIFEARRALPWWEEGLSLLPLLDWRSRACVAAMAGIYRRLFTAIQRQPTAVLTSRLSLPTWEKAWVATCALAGVGM